MRFKTVIAALRFAVYLQFLAPRPAQNNSIKLAERLAAFPAAKVPVTGIVNIHWNQNQVPFIEAENDHDLPLTLGMVHAHLRLGQMEVMRRLAYGRLSEMVGPIGFNIDHTLRIVQFNRAVPEIIATLPEQTRKWLEGFVTGINHYLANVEKLPHEFKLFNLKRENWSIADILTIGRLCSADYIWIVWNKLLRLRSSPQWRQTWARLLEADIGLDITDQGLGAATLQAVNNRSGSNSIAVGAKLSESGAAWIASDPHLGLSLPNNWLMLGYKSPSHHAGGLMIPALPFFGLGRNPQIAWGGTNLHALTSELYDVSSIARNELRLREESINIRWGKKRKVIIRESSLGPILSDSPLYKGVNSQLALKWSGHYGSDEITAMLNISRARSWEEFRTGLDDYAVPGLNMVYADYNGNIGHAMAAKIPKDAERKPHDLINTTNRDWNGFLTSSALPVNYNPEAGFIASANDRPVKAEQVIGRFFSPQNRFNRLSSILSSTSSINFSQLAQLQQDVELETAKSLARFMADIVKDVIFNRKQELIIFHLKAWDGRYEADSTGAAVFEMVLYHFAAGYYPASTLAAYSSSLALREVINKDIRTGNAAAAVEKAVKLAAETRHLPKWGKIHRLQLKHPLGGLPFIGRRYRYFDLGVAGGSETVMKTANGLTDGRHNVSYGSNARHISDMGNIDNNYFLILGGQDGWFGSMSFTDQVALWQKGEYIQLPLQMEEVKKTFTHITTLAPQI